MTLKGVAARNIRTLLHYRRQLEFKFSSNIEEKHADSSTTKLYRQAQTLVQVGKYKSVPHCHRRVNLVQRSDTVNKNMVYKSSTVNKSITTTGKLTENTIRSIEQDHRKFHPNHRSS